MGSNTETIAVPYYGHHLYITLVLDPALSVDRRVEVVAQSWWVLYTAMHQHILN